MSSFLLFKEKGIYLYLEGKKMFNTNLKFLGQVLINQ